MCKTDAPKYNDFGAGFLEASIKTSGNTQNFVSSPLSVLVLLSTLLNAKGPKEDTAKEICKGILGAKDTGHCDRLDYTRVVEDLEKIRTRVQDGQKALSMASGLFMARGFQPYPRFVRAFSMLRDNTVKTTNFETSEAFNAINEWARKSTNGLIDRFYNSEGEVDPATIMVLLNAIAFQDNWRKPFDLYATKQDGDFFLRPNEIVKVPMMSDTGQMVLFDKADDFKMVAKPFKDDRFKFVVILPKERFNLGDVEKELKEEFQWRLVDDVSNIEEVQLVLPKFKVKHEIDLIPLLKKMGIHKLFEQGAANLTGISATPTYVGDAKQVAMLEVDENGVKAAAVTGMGVMPMSMPPPPVEFLVDQPFYCAIYDSVLRMPLFIARIVDPRN